MTIINVAMKIEDLNTQFSHEIASLVVIRMDAVLLQKEIAPMSQ